jgi:hypothetical protein
VVGDPGATCAGLAAIVTVGAAAGGAATPVPHEVENDKAKSMLQMNKADHERERGIFSIIMVFLNTERRKPSLLLDVIGAQRTGIAIEA